MRLSGNYCSRDTLSNSRVAGKILLQNPVFFLVSTLCDFATIFLFGMLAPLRDSMVNQAYTLGTAATATGRVWEQGLLFTLMQDGVRAQTMSVLGMFLGLLAVTYVIYVVFQSMAWFAALRTIGVEMQLSQYFRVFARLNVLWFLLYALFQVIDLVISVRHSLLERVAQTSLPNVLGTVFFVVAGFGALLGMVSYVKLSLKPTFQAVCTIDFFFFALLVFAVGLSLDGLIRALFQLSFDVGIGVGLLVLPITAAFLRLFTVIQFAEAH